MDYEEPTEAEVDEQLAFEEFKLAMEREKDPDWVTNVNADLQIESDKNKI